MEQLLLHLFGDYILQSHWMAGAKRKYTYAAALHAGAYTAPFYLLATAAPNPHLAMAVIFWTHFFIDRFGLARYVIWLKNWSGEFRPWLMVEDFDVWKAKGGDTDKRFPHFFQPTPPWRFCEETGFPPNDPEPFLAVWLLIIVDNTLHLAINYAALRWL